jgi:choice-of-anchor B domain-containing protein
MKKSLFLFLTICLLPSAFRLCFGQYPHQNINLLSNWDTAITVPEPVYNIRYSSVWGWMDTQDNKEYAIIGSTDGTYFIDVSNPAAPVVRDYVKGRRDSCIWREYKTYQKYLYTVSDDQVNAFNQNSLQIIDMSYLPDSVHVVYDSDTLFMRSHTVFIEGNIMYCGYVNTHTKMYTMAAYSLANPVAPALIQPLDSDFTLPNGSIVHDMFVRNDTVYASCGDDGLYIFKFTGGHFTLIGSLTNYLNQGYNHSSALTADGKTLIFADEVPTKLPVKSLDVSNLSNLTVLQEFKPTPTDTATPHNPFIRQGDNSRVVISYYQSGVQVFDITDPANITRSGFFDTAPFNCPTCPGWGRQYSGCWGAYVDLPSGILLASDMQNGLFVLDATAAMGIAQVGTNTISVDVSPNPFTADFQVNFSLVSGEKLTYELADITGKIILHNTMNAPSGKSANTIEGKYLSAGTYLLNIKGENISLTKKLIKTNK